MGRMPAILFLKAAGIPEGARWITVRPNGPGTEGRPVLIQPHPSGKGFSVVGGAGGKLNYLHLTGVRSEAEYSQRAKETAAARRDQRKDRAKRDREAGLTNPKAAARQNLSLAAQAAREDFVKTVSEALAWKPEDTRFREEDHQDKPSSEVKRLEEEHFGRLYNTAKEAVAAQRARILADAQMRDEVDVALEPHPDRPEAITVADLDPVSGDTPRSLGFQPKYDERAAAAGAKPEDIQAEAAAVAGKPPKEPAAEQPALPGTGAVDNPGGNSGSVAEGDGQPNPKSDPERQPDIAAKTAEALDTVREPIGPRVDPKARASAKAAMAVLKAERELAAKLREVRTRAKEIEKADRAEDIEPTAFVLEVSGKPVTDADVLRSVEDDLRTIRTRGFLTAAKEAGAHDIPRHVGIGAFNSVNALALATSGTALMDRSVVDVLGPAAAAQALAHRLATDLPAEEMAAITEAMGRYHVDHYMARSNDAMEEARSLQEQAAEIHLGEARTGGDLAVAQELNQKRREMVNRSKAILAQALGEMETNAAIVTALEKPKRDRITVPMGQLAPTEAITRLRALGLDRGDYTIERAGPNTITVIQPAGIAKLTQPIAAEDIQRVNTALSIMRGDQDEDDWLPAGVANRPDFGTDAPLGVAPRLAESFPANPADPAQAVRDYIGGRMADGDAPADILAGLLSEDVMQRAGDRAAFLEAVEEVAPLYGEDGKMLRVEAHAERFEKLADDFVKARYGTERSAFHRQRVVEDEKTVEALHRAFAAVPEGMLALRPVGDLTAQDQGAIRSHFAKEFGRADPAAQEKRARVEALDGQEPERETDGLFGRATNPEWTRWKQERDAAAADAAGAEFTWSRYVDVLGGPAAAYQAMQDHIRGRLMDAFGREHNKLRPDAPLRMGRTNIRGDLEHLDAIDPKARERRQEEHAGLVDRLRNRVGGKYAAGSVADKIAATRAAEEAAAQAQMGLFGMEPEAPAAGGPLPENTAPLGPGERVTVGAAAERALAGIAARTGRMWQPGQPAQLFRPTMSGRFAGRQRAVKLIEANKRMVLGMGVGSGKTSISLAAFTHLKEKGKAKRGLFLVPSVVQGQFHTESLAMLEPGKFSWHAKPGASREERIAAMKDPGHDFAVFTHQSFRDDVMHLAAEQAGVDPAEMGERLAGMTPEARSEAIHDTLAKAGIDFDYLAIDEGHNLLNRQGKANSRMADVVDAVSARMGHYVNMTADPVKNDASEVFDLLRKMDPARYSDRDAFMRKYGVDTDSAKEGLRREMARHAYTASIPSGVKAHKSQVQVTLHPEDSARVEGIQRAAGALRLARLENRTDIAAARELSPNSFEGVPPEQHEAVARKIADALGVVRDAAMRHAINGKGKQDAVSRLAAERKGKPGVIFCHHLEQVKALEARLRAEGHKVITMTGANSAKEKDRIKREFTRGDHHILIASDAGLVGANLQAGKWLTQFDTPQTAMAHAQRNGRIDRIGQTQDVELIDLLADHPAERTARDRLARKYGLRDIVTSPLDTLDDTGLAGMLRRIRTERAERAPEAPADPKAA
jgi:superfamily II DNA or RNA helicase